MTGKEFLKLVTHKRIPLSCIAVRLNCKLATLKALNNVENMPKAYIIKFISAFQESLSENDLYALTH